MEPLISVIVPIYNIAGYLSACVKSILQQEYTNLEILLIDDGSTDQSPELCNRFAKEDSRIRVIHKKNGGLSSARNAGLDVATGEYLVFVDGDDFIAPNMIRCLWERLCKDETDMAICSFWYVDEEGKKAEASDRSPLIDEILTKEELLMRMNLNIYGYWYYTVPVNKLYRRCIWEKLRYPEGKIYEDEFLIPYLFERTGKASILSEKLYYYVQRENSITHVNKENSFKKLDLIEALNDRRKFLHRKGYRKLSKETADLLYTVWMKIFVNVFRKPKDYFRCFLKVEGSVWGMLREGGWSGYKLQYRYMENMGKSVVRYYIRGKVK